ncbi:GntR family transcriptional regulator [Pseudomonas typographi]|uniref:GntR family transcriptional regulator n=1 Tax=Pseudomonas typographi TaxID=2715964 RepID=A0ABR7Z0Z9_9PSED|nr:GntR family transcriptional regulator [Pseudomonas typographi]MBD1553406.1 GntR family transcriptional regulator [Pseudomonas typographi]MBD1588722.1 GntR family transcriptional regulator [Pseudomonas typographi]MBD1599062.1 GntR family transcriptional regulator [Pseudomonas typographi]
MLTDDRSSIRPRKARTTGQILGTADKRDTIYERILHAVMEHRLIPGTKLVEEKLASVFEVNRTRIREVLARLAHEGVVTTIPNRGAFVASPSVEEARYIFHARRILEPALIRTLVTQADEERIRRLYDHVAQERAAREAGDKRAVIRLSGEFHLLIAEMVGSPPLLKLMRELASLTCLIILLYDSPNVPACPNHEHLEIIKAIEQGQGENAVDLVIAHLNHIEETLDLSVSEEQEVDLEEIFG